MSSKKEGYKRYLAGRIMHIVFGEKKYSEKAEKIIEEEIWEQFATLSASTEDGYWTKSFDELCIEIIDILFPTSPNMTDLFSHTPIASVYLHN